MDGLLLRVLGFRSVQVSFIGDAADFFEKKDLAVAEVFSFTGLPMEPLCEYRNTGNGGLEFNLHHANDVHIYRFTEAVPELVAAKLTPFLKAMSATLSEGCVVNAVLVVDDVVAQE